MRNVNTSLATREDFFVEGHVTRNCHVKNISAKSLAMKTSA